MTNVLVINASQNTETSKTRGLVDHYLKALSDNGHELSIKTRDIGTTPPPHLTGATIGAFFTPADDRSDEQQALVALSDEIVAEVQNADLIVVGSPMQNFGVSSGLKAWFDHLARVGVTFQYTENGPQGLLGGRKVVVVAASGGDYTEASPVAHLNNHAPHFKTFFGFLGITDLTVIEAPGTAMGEDGVRAAEEQLVDVAAKGITGAAVAA